jgi:hypothetical protein
VLRKTVLIIGGLFLAGGVAMIISGHCLPAIGPFIIGITITMSVIFEPRYKSIIDTAPTGPEWAKTAESFEDTRTQKVVEVWFNMKTSERLYVKKKTQQ